jgi:protein-tyrosine phosphatase
MALARALSAEGVTHVAATPHGPGSSHARHHDPTLLRELVMQLRQHIQRARIGLQVTLGTELVLDIDMVDQLRAGALLPYGSSRAILLETPSHIVFEHLERAIFELQLVGYRIVLAHPERTRAFQENPNLLVPLVERGVLMQITAGSLAGLHGDRLREVATQLLCHDLAHIIASDAHTPTGTRAPAMRDALAYASMLVGEDNAHAMVSTIPEALLNDGPLPALSPRSIPMAATTRASWWQRRRQSVTR